jgi:hypothetical protein
VRRARRGAAPSGPARARIPNGRRRHFLSQASLFLSQLGLFLSQFGLFLSQFRLQCRAVQERANCKHRGERDERRRTVGIGSLDPGLGMAPVAGGVVTITSDAPGRIEGDLSLDLGGAKLTGHFVIAGP